MVYIGIDLGTTYSCVSVVEEGKPIMIVSDDDKFIIPSAVAYYGKQITAEDPALDCDTDATNILYDSKRLIGGFLPDEGSFFPFKIETRNRVVGYVINAGQRNERFLRPEEVSAEILKKLKTIAKKYLQEKVTGAVVTVPAFFNNDQVSATIRAIQMAGLDLKYLLEEPTAAAIAYYNKISIADSTIMIFDWGGGTLDISIAEIKNEKPDVKSVCGDAHLGGQDFDERIMKYVIEEIKKLNNYNMLQQPILMKRLRRACKKAKESLSFQMESCNVSLDINDNTSVNVKISRSKFNQLCKDLFDKAMRMVERALRNAQISTEQIDDVILVGGSTRIPNIQQRLMDKFGSAKLKFSLNPDEAVAYGAAIIANALEKGTKIPLINNRIIELSQNINNSQIGENNSFNNSQKTLFYYLHLNNYEVEARIGLFNSFTCSVEAIAKFHNCYAPYEVATTKDKIFAISSFNKRCFEIFDLNTRQISRGPNPPEWHFGASVAYFKDKLYYLGGNTDRVDVLIDGQWQIGPAFPHPISRVQTITCDEMLYVIDGWNKKIYRLSDDERELIEIKKIPRRRGYFGVASLNGRIYITGGRNHFNSMKSCFCLNPSASVDNQISPIADMHYARCRHSLVAANGKLYAIGGYQDFLPAIFRNSIEEYDPQTDKWRKTRKINFEQGCRQS